MPKSKTRKKPSQAPRPERPALTAASGIAYTVEGLDLLARLPDGDHVRVPMSLTGDDLDRIIPLMKRLETGEAGDRDVEETYGAFREIFPEDVWRITGALPIAWCMDIRGEWVRRLGALMGKARLA